MSTLTDLLFGVALLYIILVQNVHVITVLLLCTAVLAPQIASINVRHWLAIRTCVDALLQCVGSIGDLFIVLCARIHAKQLLLRVDRFFGTVPSNINEILARGLALSRGIIGVLMSVRAFVYTFCRL